MADFPAYTVLLIAGPEPLITKLCQILLIDFVIINQIRR